MKIEILKAGVNEKLLIRIAYLASAAFVAGSIYAVIAGANTAATRPPVSHAEKMRF